MNVFEKIEKQQKTLKENSAPWVVGEQLKEICADPRCAELVCTDLDNPEMGLVNCEKKIKEYADKHKTGGNFSFVSPKVAEGIIRSFYGLPEAGTVTQVSTSGQGIINLDDYM